MWMIAFWPDHVTHKSNLMKRKVSYLRDSGDSLLVAVLWVRYSESHLAEIHIGPEQQIYFKKWLSLQESKEDSQEPKENLGCSQT